MAKPSVGKIVWFELPVADVERAKAFYGEMFGWRFERFSEFETLEVLHPAFAGHVIEVSLTADGQVRHLGLLG